MKGEQIGLLHGSLRDDRVHKEASRLLVVHHVVLDVTDNMLPLFAFHQVANHGAREERIFTCIFKVAPIAGFADQIDSSPQSHVESLRPQFFADHGPKFAS